MGDLMDQILTVKDGMIGHGSHVKTKQPEETEMLMKLWVWAAGCVMEHHQK